MSMRIKCSYCEGELFEHEAVETEVVGVFCTDECLNAWEYEIEGDQEAMEREQREAAE